jgi:hypothetical protein
MNLAALPLAGVEMGQQVRQLWPWPPSSVWQGQVQWTAYFCARGCSLAMLAFQLLDIWGASENKYWSE